MRIQLDWKLMSLVAGYWRIAVLVAIAVVGLILGVTTLTSFGQSGVKVTPFPANPDEGLGDEARAEQYAAARSEFEAKYLAWLGEYLASGSDPWSLPLIEVQDRFVEGLPSLEVATSSADVIGIGTVKEVDFEPYGARTTFEFTDPIKGSGSTYVITQTGGPFPDPDWETARLHVGPNDPLMRPGTRALLFLQHDAATGLYYVQSFTGHYEILGGRVRALDGNSFAKAIDGKTEAEARNAVVQALATNS